MTLSDGRTANLSHGEQIRDFTDVDAIADAYLRALEAPRTACALTYHLGSGIGTTTRDLAAMVAEVTGNAHLLRFGAGTTEDQDLPVLVADPSRARNTLGWSAPPDLRRSVHDVVDWWLHQRPFERVAVGRQISIPPQGRWHESLQNL
jgi:nucleoside-diphosphate-sugar epimerase